MFCEKISIFFFFIGNLLSAVFLEWQLYIFFLKCLLSVFFNTLTHVH